MEIKYKITALSAVMVAWAMLWLVLPPEPGQTINAIEWIFFGATELAAFVLLIKWLGDYLQQRDNNRIRRVLQKHDTRAN